MLEKVTLFANSVIVELVKMMSHGVGWTPIPIQLVLKRAT